MICTNLCLSQRESEWVWDLGFCDIIVCTMNNNTIVFNLPVKGSGERYLGLSTRMGQQPSGRSWDSELAI